MARKAVAKAVASRATSSEKVERVTISAPNFKTSMFRVKGTAPYLQNRFSKKAMDQMAEKMALGSQSAKEGRAKRKSRDFDDDMEQAQHIAEDGWCGVPASAIRNACIDVCRMVGYKMTHAKMSIFIEADGFDRVDGMPLVKLVASKPERTDMAVRNATGVADIRVRPMWRIWELKIRVRYDADQFSATDVANLLMRAGLQVGIGEGRCFSKESNGIGMGSFEIA